MCIYSRCLYSRLIDKHLEKIVMPIFVVGWCIREISLWMYPGIMIHRKRGCIGSQSGCMLWQFASVWWHVLGGCLRVDDDDSYHQF